MSLCNVYIEQNKVRQSTIDYAVCSKALGRDIAQAFATGPSVGHKLVYSSGSEFSDAHHLQ